MRNRRMATRTHHPEAIDIFARLDRLGLKQRELANALGIEETKVSKMRAGTRRLTAAEVLKAREWLGNIEHNRAAGISSQEPDLPVSPDLIAYVRIDIMPTYAGMGGGGVGRVR
jgi:transcriptional regulator with XRE-family HTH domain